MYDNLCQILTCLFGQPWRLCMLNWTLGTSFFSDSLRTACLFTTSTYLHLIYFDDIESIIQCLVEFEWISFGWLRRHSILLKKNFFIWKNNFQPILYHQRTLYKQTGMCDGCEQWGLRWLTGKAFVQVNLVIRTASVTFVLKLGNVLNMCHPERVLNKPFLASFTIAGVL